MPSTSASTASKVADYGVAEDRSAELDGYAVNFVTIKQTHDLDPMLAAVPGGNCTCPHWGYVQGQADRALRRSRGDLPDRRRLLHAPWSRPSCRSWTELLQISPADKLAEIEAAAAAAIQAGPGR